jgi:hypothetical protein
MRASENVSQIKIILSAQTSYLMLVWKGGRLVYVEIVDWRCNHLVKRRWGFPGDATSEVSAIKA